MVITTIAAAESTSRAKYSGASSPVGRMYPSDSSSARNSADTTRMPRKMAKASTRTIAARVTVGAVVTDVDPLPRQRAPGGERAEERDDGGDGNDRRARAQHRAQQHDQHAGPRQGEHRGDRQPVDVRRHDRVGRDRGEGDDGHFVVSFGPGFGTERASGPWFETPGSR